jgi:hypothetical protein
MKIVKRQTVSATGTNTTTAVIPPYNGQIVARNIWYDSPDAGTLTVYPASGKTTANAAVAAATTIVIVTDSAGKVDGAVIAATDWLIVHDSTAGGSGWQLRDVSTVAAVSSSTVSIVVTAALTCAAGDAVYIVRVADIAAHTTAAETIKDLAYLFSGYPDCPVALVLAATGTCRLSVMANYESL